MGALIEIGIVVAFLLISNLKSTTHPAVRPRIAIHVIQPPKHRHLPSKPKPPVPHMPLPLPVPLPRPVVHRTPTLKPLLARTPTPGALIMPELPVPPPAPPAEPSPSVAQNAIALYAAMVREQIQGEAHVPEAVRLMHLRGVAVIGFELEPSGHLVWARLVRSSGIGAIDRAALAAVKSGSYPPFSKSMPKQATVFEVEVHLTAYS